MANLSQNEGGVGKEARAVIPAVLPAALLAVLLVALVASALVFPLLLHGPSCGHDFGFHLQSWMEVSAQMRHGVLLPRWAYSPAFNAGEPRFMFYPPLSWLLGSVLLLLLPANVVPAAFTFVALTLAGWGMWSLARRYAGEGGALLAAAAYLVNPYMLFTAFERTAFAELLAAAWLPWLLRAALADRVSVLAVAAPIALLWLTNAPAAVMGTYALAMVMAVRLWRSWRRGRRVAAAYGRSWTELLQPSLTAGGGLALGLALAGFYLLPAAWERRYVQIAMAIIPNMRVEDNFLFGHTGNGPHDQVLHTASLVAVSLVALTAVVVLALVLRLRRNQGAETPPVAVVLGVLSAAITLLLFRVTLPLWRVLPELAFLQFPWRWLAVLGCVFGAGVALLLAGKQISLIASAAAAVVVAAVCSSVSLVPFRQGCEAHELPQERIALFATHHGVGATDEYTPTTADNDQLRWDDPAWWVATDSNAPAPGTVPNPAATIENYDEPPPLEQTISGQAPHHLHLDVKGPEDLILNLRDYPAWVVTVNGATAAHLQRDDGLIAVPLPAGSDQIDVHWRRLPDVWLGDGLSLCALGVAAALQLRSRRIRVQA